MCDNDRTEELEKIIKEQKEMIDKLINAQKSSFKEKIEPKKEKVDDAMKAMFSIFTNKEVQRHFVKAGVEFLSGIEALIKAVPVPDNVKETMKKASEAKDDFVKDVVDELNSSKQKAAGKKKIKKIDVE